MFVSYSFSSFFFCECPRVNTIVNLPQESVFSLSCSSPKKPKCLSLSICFFFLLDVVTLTTFINMYLCNSFFDRFLIYLKMLT